MTTAAATLIRGDGQVERREAQRSRGVLRTLADAVTRAPRKTGLALPF